MPRTARATLTISGTSGTNWTVGNSALTLVYDSANANITSIIVAGHSTNILDPNNQKLYPEFAGTPFGAGTQTPGFQQGANYIDFWTTTQANGTTNPDTYSFHYVLYNNDPAIHMYEVVQHAAGDPVGSVGQGQFLMRINPALVTTQYQVNVGPNNSGAKITNYPNSGINGSNNDPINVAGGTAGRDVQDATVDLTGTAAAATLGNDFYTKYNFAGYEQFHQAHLEYGSTYAVSDIVVSPESMTGGPTKQNLEFTNTILMNEFLSGHEGTSGYSYTPPANVDSSRLFGPYVFRITATNGESGAQLYQDAVNSIPAYKSLNDGDAELLASGYTPSTQRGDLQVTIHSAAGWSANANNNTVVLSDNQTNFQQSATGYQYWTQLSSTGAGTLNGAVPGTYRMSVYQLGQWGETRYDNVVVQNGKITLPQNAAFTPENFSHFTPIWTLGTPDRSAHEFLNGSDASGNAVRQFQGNYDYWAEEQALGNPGKVVYYATAVPGHAATNDPSKWIANQWRAFNPGLYDAANNTTDNYANIAPAYVTAGGGPATYTGAPWEVHFITSATQTSQGRYVTLSVGLAAVEASLTVTLNGHGETWHSSGDSDPMVRSSDSGYYQWIAFEWDNNSGTILNAAGIDNVITFSVSQNDGVMYDALRMEISPTSANPSVTGWHDYAYVNSNGSSNAANANDALGLSLAQNFANAPEPATLAFLGLGALVLLRSPRR